MEIPPIAFIDVEVEPQTHMILDIGSVRDYDRTFHSGSISSFIDFLRGAEFICGHNILNHDLNYIGKPFLRLVLICQIALIH